MTTRRTMKTVTASGEVLKVYQTGDRPILVLCSDGCHYICKYKQPGYAAYKLLNELVGGSFAKVWGISTPVTSLVVNDPIIWDDAGISHENIVNKLAEKGKVSIEPDNETIVALDVESANIDSSNNNQ